MSLRNYIMALDIDVPSRDKLSDDIQQYFAVCDEDIWDIANIAGFYNMTNRIASAVDMQPNPEYHGMHRTGPDQR